MKDTTTVFQPKTNIDSVNWYVTLKCNYNCKFCSVKKQKSTITEILDAETILFRLYDLGFEKINIVGGEPLLYPFICDITKMAKKIGFITTLRTNGSLLTSSKIAILSPYLDWIELPLDSSKEEVEKELGRGCGKHVQNIQRVSNILKCTDVKLKINTIITKLNCKEDLKPFIRALNPDKWEIFKALNIKDEKYSKFLISDREFLNYQKLNENIILKSGEEPVFNQHTNTIDSCSILLSSKDINDISKNIYSVLTLNCDGSITVIEKNSIHN
ncbi:viperin family antiviral radical SAM protein [Methanolobus vulcani]|uniref:Radical SAM protein n=1 Tax=Methanolobus vulcani TaxID=38026 RepID=A0A7Z8P1F1_9EURY|nr:viperin family antiviral radical SAM protein [Methanolobus vulcani]TQD23573.1 radical SAM protein [Methanolobus vulcani]